MKRPFSSSFLPLPLPPPPVTQVLNHLTFATSTSLPPSLPPSLSDVMEVNFSPKNWAGWNESKKKTIYLFLYVGNDLSPFQAVADNGARREQEALAAQRRAQREADDKKKQGGGGQAEKGKKSSNSFFAKVQNFKNSVLPQSRSAIGFTSSSCCCRHLIPVL